MMGLSRPVGMGIVPRTLLLSLYLALTTASNANAQELSREKVEALRKSVAFIRDQNSQGSGFLVHRAGNKGLLATNAHVVDEGEKLNRSVKCAFHAGTRSEFIVDGKVVGIDRQQDLAFVSVEHANLPPVLKLDTKPELFETQNVVIAGFPFGSNLATSSVNPQVTISKGSISSLRRTVLRSPTLIQIDVSVNPGNSGGPLVNHAGDVIGVVTIKVEGTQLGFAIPSSSLSDALNGSVASVRVANSPTPSGIPNFSLEANLIDPLKQITSVQLNLIEEVNAKADYTSHDTWPQLPSYKSLASQQIENGIAKFPIDRDMQIKQPLILQALCRRRSGNVHVTELFNSNLPSPPSAPTPRSKPSAESTPDSKPTPNYSRDSSLPDQWVTRIELGPALVSPSALSSKTNTKDNARKQLESTDPNASNSNPSVPSLTTNAEYGESKKMYSLEPQPTPKIQAMSESYLIEGWKVRRLLIPVQELSSIYFGDNGKSIVTHTHSQQLLQRFDFATGKLNASFKIPGSFDSLRQIASGFLLLDRGSGEILVLDESLEPTRVMTCPLNLKLFTSAVSDVGVLAKDAKPWRETTLCNFKLGRCYGIKDFPELVQDFTIVGDTLFTLSSSKIYRFAFDASGKIIDQSSKSISKHARSWITLPTFVPANDASIVAIAPQPLGGSLTASQSNTELLIWNTKLEEQYTHTTDLPVTLLNDNQWVSSTAGKLTFASSDSKGSPLVMPGMASAIRQIASYGTNQVAILSGTGVFVADREQ